MQSTDQNPPRVTLVLRDMVDEMRKAGIERIEVNTLEQALDSVALRLR